MTNVPSSWTVVPIVDVLAPSQNGKPFQQGWSPQCESHPASDEAWGVLKTTAIQPGQFWDHENKQLPEGLEPRPHTEVQAGDLLMTCAGPRSRCGVVCLVEHTRPRLMMSGKMYRFRPSAEIMDSRFLTYFIQSRSAQVAIDAMKTGISDSGLNLTHDRFATLAVPVPPRREQRRIVAKIEELFSELDKGVESLTTAREQLKVYRQAVLKAAVEGSLTAEWRKEQPKTEPASELLERILVERRRRWEEEQRLKFNERGRELPKDWRVKYKKPLSPDTTNLPPLPEQWCWVSWTQVGFSQNGRPFPSKEYQSSGIKLLRPGNLFADGLVRWTDKNTRCLPPHYVNDDADLLVRGRELVINLTAQSLKDDFLGRVCITAQGEECLLNQRLARLTPVLISPEFMLVVFRSALFRDFVARLNTGSLIQHMFTSQIDDDFAFPLPPLEEQREMVAAVEAQLSVIDHLEGDLDAELANAQVLRQSVLHQAFSGKLVSQDANDEPASVLLERIRAAPEEGAATQRRNKRNGKKEAA